MRRNEPESGPRFQQLGSRGMIELEASAQTQRRLQALLHSSREGEFDMQRALFETEESSAAQSRHQVDHVKLASQQDRRTEDVRTASRRDSVDWQYGSGKQSAPISSYCQTDWKRSNELHSLAL